MLRTLKEKRDMSLNEVKLTVAIEDPTKREQKEYMGIEVSPPADAFPICAWRCCAELHALSRTAKTSNAHVRGAQWMCSIR